MEGLDDRIELMYRSSYVTLRQERLDVALGSCVDIVQVPFAGSEYFQMTE